MPTVGLRHPIIVVKTLKIGQSLVADIVYHRGLANLTATVIPVGLFPQPLGYGLAYALLDIIGEHTDIIPFIVLHLPVTSPSYPTAYPSSCRKRAYRSYPTIRLWSGR